MRIIKWAREKGYKIEAIGVSHGEGICVYCAEAMVNAGVPINSSEIAWNWRDPKGGRPEPLELDLLNQSHGWLGGLPPRFYPRQ